MLAAPAGEARCAITRQLPPALAELENSLISCCSLTVWLPGSPREGLCCPHTQQGHPGCAGTWCPHLSPRGWQLRAWCCSWHRLCSGWATTCHRVKCTTSESKVLFALLKLDFNFFKIQIFFFSGCGAFHQPFLVAERWCAQGRFHCLKGSCGSCKQDAQASPSLLVYPNLLHLTSPYPGFPVCQACVICLYFKAE